MHVLVIPGEWTTEILNTACNTLWEYNSLYRGRKNIRYIGVKNVNTASQVNFKVKICVVFVCKIIIQNFSGLFKNVTLQTIYVISAYDENHL